MNDPSDTYEDIINLPHHVSRIHPHMTLEERAAQFSPFAALTGYEAAIDKTRRRAQQELEEDPLYQKALSLSRRDGEAVDHTPFYPRKSDRTS